MLTPPYWMTNRTVDELEGDELQTFEKVYQDFTDIFEEEEKSFSPTYGNATYRIDIMRRGWKIGFDFSIFKEAYVNVTYLDLLSFIYFKQNRVLPEPPKL